MKREKLNLLLDERRIKLRLALSGKNNMAGETRKSLHLRLAQRQTLFELFVVIIRIKGVMPGKIDTKIPEWGSRSLHDIVMRATVTRMYTDYSEGTPYSCLLNNNGNQIHKSMSNKTQLA